MKKYFVENDPELKYIRWQSEECNMYDIKVGDIFFKKEKMFLNFLF